ncbi:hypothetical protein EC957_005694 [Mortierella hygrophila]|uniref:Uncharacterized protein n=1 Tax=Mortierella hygrophila TaxID=979708 RepID=A0A9P6FES0_9FUNG|nr:hypothetical protein EC957_005694 [Mortierella hygrophila]
MSGIPARNYDVEHHAERYIVAMRTLDAEIQELEELYTASVATGKEDKDLAKQLQERRARVQMLLAKRGLTATFAVPTATIAWPGESS